MPPSEQIPTELRVKSCSNCSRSTGEQASGAVLETRFHVPPPSRAATTPTTRWRHHFRPPLLAQPSAVLAFLPRVLIQEPHHLHIALGFPRASSLAAHS